MSYRNTKWRYQEAVSKKLKRMGFTPPDSIARLLFDLSFKLDGRFGKTDYEGSRCYVRGLTYSKWVEQLIEANWLSRKNVPPGTVKTNVDYITFEPGSELKPYLKLEEEWRKQNATMQDLEELHDRMREEIREQVREELSAEIGPLKKRLEANEMQIAELTVFLKEIGFGEPYRLENLRRQFETTGLKVLRGGR